MDKNSQGDASGVIFRRLADITPIPTAHGLGLKSVLLHGNETQSSITQIARTVLAPGDLVEPHSHPTMDECFLILSGQCTIKINEIYYLCNPDDFLKVPAGTVHSIQTESGLEIITIGVAL